MITLGAGEFRVQCLKLIEMAHHQHETVIVTKRGKPVAKLIPYEENPPKLFGALEGSVIIKADITQPMEDAWDAEQ